MKVGRSHDSHILPLSKMEHFHQDEPWFHKPWPIMLIMPPEKKILPSNLMGHALRKERPEAPGSVVWS